MKANRLFVVFCVLLLLALACARTKTPDPAKPTSQLEGEVTRTLTYDGLERSYLLYVPAFMDLEQPVPVVFVFHGGTGNARSAVIMSRFSEVADQNDFVVIYPNGTNRLGDDAILTWNAGDCCGYAQRQKVDDVGFVSAIVSDLQSLVTVDPKRIYATGMSNGGMLVNRLACEATDVFAAIAPVAGTLNFPQCDPSQSISVIEFHGTADQHVPYAGGYGPASLTDVDFASVQDTIEFWVTSNQCDSRPQVNSHEDIQHEKWDECADSTVVELYTIINGEHHWPGGSFSGSTQTISASQLIWEFFEAHPKP